MQNEAPQGTSHTAIRGLRVLPLLLSKNNVQFYTGHALLFRLMLSKTGADKCSDRRAAPWCSGTACIPAHPRPASSPAATPGSAVSAEMESDAAPPHVSVRTAGNERVPARRSCARPEGAEGAHGALPRPAGPAGRAVPRAGCGPVPELRLESDTATSTLVTSSCRLRSSSSISRRIFSRSAFRLAPAGPSRRDMAVPQPPGTTRAVPPRPRPLRPPTNHRGARRSAEPRARDIRQPMGAQLRQERDPRVASAFNRSVTRIAAPGPTAAPLPEPQRVRSSVLHGRPFPQLRPLGERGEGRGRAFLPALLVVSGAEQGAAVPLAVG